ncbi:hypothetical protein MOKP64_04280 [Mycobacterium avium subsp. hominissuis]
MLTIDAGWRGRLHGNATDWLHVYVSLCQLVGLADDSDAAIVGPIRQRELPAFGTD